MHGMMARVAMIGAVMLCVMAAVAFGQQMGALPGAVILDSPRDVNAPAQTLGVRIPSHGVNLNGILLQAAGMGPHPTVILLHGFPGYDGVLDVGHAIRRAGLNVLSFHYRGSWGSDGPFSFAHCVEDAEAALSFLRDPKVAEKYRVDPARVYSVGHSMGGFVAIMLAARAPTLGGVAYLSGWDIGSDASSWKRKPPQATVDDFENTALRLHGTSGRELLKEALSHVKDWSLATLAPRISDRPLLMTFAEYDLDYPPNINHEPLRRAVEARGGRQLEIRSLPTDHNYADHRVSLSGAVIDWLQRAVGVDQ